MNNNKKESFFWTSYSDLMTSLFFVMLTFFILTVALMKKQAQVTKDQLDKIKEIEASINNIDTTYFEYDKTHKKHILKIDVSFHTYSFNIDDVSKEDQIRLKDAGSIIYDFIRNSNHEAKYLLIIEGQSSKDGYFKDDYKNNYVLSYQRALTLYKFWSKNHVLFNDGNKCEVIISGSGENGSLRKKPDDYRNEANQRFLIHIIPKPGIISNRNLKYIIK